MTHILETLSFLNPALLAALCLLPIIWLLLKITPPPPKIINFPAARFLNNLKTETKTSAQTPWWMLFLRLLIAALIIIAMAGPILNKAAALPGQSAIRIVMDNNWAAAHNWGTIRENAIKFADRAHRDNREFYILTTTPLPGQTEPLQYGPLSTSKAKTIIDTIKPYPWPADYTTTQNIISQNTENKPSIYSIFLSAGLNGTGLESLISKLRNQSGIEIYEPSRLNLPLVLRQSNKQDLSFEIISPSTIQAGHEVTIELKDQSGLLLDKQNIALSPEQNAEINFDMPLAMRNKVHTAKIRGYQSASTTILMDQNFAKKTIGIVTPEGKNSPALTEGHFYIAQALSPYANIIQETLTKLLEHEPNISLLILPDIGGFTPAQLESLEQWVQKGGLLLRFAGPNMTQGKIHLTPVTLRQGGRALDGSLSWDEPLSLAPFPENSPFYGINIPGNITVKRQILAEPAPGLQEKTWATLKDGTPLITSDIIGRGRIILIHTTATPEWSDLALSSLFIDMLRQINNMAGRANISILSEGQLNPIQTMDAYGILQKPHSLYKSIQAANLNELTPSSMYPPGLYGQGNNQTAFNLGDNITNLSPLTKALPAGISKTTYTQNNEHNLAPILLSMALTLFLLDWLIILLLQSGLTPRIKHTAVITTFILILPLQTAKAQSTSQDSTYANAIHLAYIKSGNPLIDSTTEKGLNALSTILTNRTSVEPAGVVALDPANAELAFFPLIYWPIATQTLSISDIALQKIQNYLEQGGTILIDTRDYNSQISGQDGANMRKLKNILGSLNIPPLVPMPRDHVISKSFYLLPSFPGRYDGGDIWVQENSLSGKNGVSSLIIGSHDWAAIWASTINGNAQQQELSYRFGVNLMMYALTGNYKADQVHIPHILERLGQ